VEVVAPVTWIKIDDHFDEHPKLARVGPLGHALWFAGLAYCNRNLTNGFIPWAIARTLVSWDFLDETGTARIYIGSVEIVSEEGAVRSEYVIGLLVRAGVWEDASGGFAVHDYLDFQPSRASVLKERKRLSVVRAKAGKKGAASTHGKRGGKRGGKALANAGQKGWQSSGPVPVPLIDTGVSIPPSPQKTDPIWTYHQLTTRTPSKGGLVWINRLADDYGDDATSKAMAAEWTDDPELKTFIGRIETRLAAATRKADKTAAARNAKEEAEYQRSIQEGRDKMTPEAQAQADAAIAGLGDIVKGIA